MYYNNKIEIIKCNIRIISCDIDQFHNVNTIILDENDIFSLPSELFTMTWLTRLHLSYNKLQFLPKEIEKLVNLSELAINRNKLAHLPKEIKEITKLSRLWFSYNQFPNISYSVNNPWNALNSLAGLFPDIFV